jgi:predicted ATPase/class 3 adenylate cyclase/predicted Ser/Thr protein kinase
MDSEASSKILISESNNSRVYRIQSANSKKSRIVKSSKISDLSGLYNEFQIMDDNLLEFAHPEMKFEDSKTVFTRDFIEGITLRQLLKRDEAGLECFLKFALPITEALFKIHEKKIIHNDLTPDNIIINEEEAIAYLIDFELSTELDVTESGSTLNFDLKANLPYISPEQTGRMNRLVDYRSDYYSLGICFYEMLSGHPPFTSNDPLEIVYAHLAHIPPTISKPNNSIPEIANRIIQKLLQKNAEERYHSLSGLMYDLNKCITEIRAGNTNIQFDLGSNDIPERLQFTRIMVGREKEIKVLYEAFYQAVSGKKSLLKVSGFSGIGKTMLIREAVKPLTKSKGIFISGKYDILHRNTPYSAFVQALDQLADLILAESEATVSKWRNSILDGVGPLAKIIIDLNHKWERILGNLEELPGLTGKEWKNRLHFVLGNLFKIIASEEHPVILFLDDCQWADDASIELLSKITANDEIKFYLTVVAYRQNEVGKTHLLSKFFEEIENYRQAPEHSISEIQLNKITTEDCTKIINVILRNPIHDLEDFSALIFGKTEGNPFLINQLLDLLYQKRLLLLNLESGEWEWNKTAILQMEVADDAAGILLDKINLLPEDCVAALVNASFFGNTFSIQSLANVTSQSEDTLHKALWPAIVAYLIIPQKKDYKYVPDFYCETGIDVSFKFAHDKLQQALYSQVKDQDKQALHYKIGTLLLDVVNEHAVFKKANHFILANEVTIHNGFKPKVTNILLEAGNKSFMAASFESAYQYLNLYVKLTPHNQISCEAFILFFEASVISGHSENVEVLVNQALNSHSNPLSRAYLFENIIRVYVADDKYKTAINFSRQALLEFGIKLPVNASKGRVIFEAIKTQFILPSKKLRRIDTFPEMQHENSIGAMRIMKEAALAFFFGELETYPILIFKMVQLSARHGNVPESLVGYSSYSIILAGVLNNANDAYILGKLVLKKMEEYADQRSVTTLGFVDGAFISHWKEPLSKLAENHLAYYHQGMEVGNTEYALYNCFWAIFYQYALGKPIPELYEEQVQLAHLVNVYNRQNQLARINSWVSTYKHLMDPSETPYVLFEDEPNVLAHLLSTKNNADYLGIYFQKLSLAVWFGDYSQAWEFTKHGEPIYDAVMSTYWIPFVRMFGCIAGIQHYKTASKEEQSKILKYYKAGHKFLKNATTIYDGNVGWMFLFIEAEYNSIIKNNYQEQAYQKAIDEARKNKFILPVTLIQLHQYLQLKAGKPGDLKSVENSVKEGLRYFGMKVVLEKRFGKQESIVSNDLAQQNTGATGNYSLDYLTILKSTQALTTEIVLDKLIFKLLSYTIENVGASFGAFLMKNEASFETKLEMISKSEGGQIKFEVKNTEPFSEIPNSVINYVKQSRLPLVIDDAVNTEPYASDSIVVKNNVLSILCIPVIHKSEILAVIYMTNSLTKAAFSKERIELIKLIAGQIGVSIENAMIYSNLDNLVKARTKQLEEEKEKSERLLLNILPNEVAQELKSTGKAKPVKYDQVTVFFCDIMGFSQRAEKMTPENLVGELDYIFKKMDEIILKYGIEKIKTIGDSYMCASGIPIPNNDSFIRVADAALEINEWIKSETEKGVNSGYEFPQIRIGIHTGPLVAGIVGSTKFAYDIWGDTVNIASRMESSGVPGRVNISESTYQLIEGQYNCEYRGEVHAKGKGDLKMYFLLNKK